MEQEFERILDKLATSTRSPRGRFSKANSWILLEKRLPHLQRRILSLHTMAGAAATLRRTIKRPGIPPGRRGCRSAAHAKQNAPLPPDRAAIKITDPEHGKPPPVNSSREDWTDDIRSVTILQPQEFPFLFY